MAKLAALPARASHNTGEYDAMNQREAARQRAQQKVAARTAAKRQQAAERIATATEQSSSGTAEAAAAARQLMSAVEGIAAGAEQTSRSIETGVRAARVMMGNSEAATNTSKALLDRVLGIQQLVTNTSDELTRLTRGVTQAAEANIESAKQVADLEKQANEIGDIVEAVVRIADQTNLLALNAAIEAARAGQHGKGFAVVADEVRNLAETSEKSARDIRELVAMIQADVRRVAEDVQNSSQAANEEAAKAKRVAGELKNVTEEMSQMATACEAVSDNAGQALKACGEYLEAGEQIASAAEENSAAAAEATASTQEQSKALEEMDKGVQELADMAEVLKSSTLGDKSGQELAAAAEEMSALVQEYSSSSRQIMTAIDQIVAGAKQAAVAAEQGAAACQQTDRVARLCQDAAESSQQRNARLTKLLSDNGHAVSEVVEGISRAASESYAAATNTRLLEERTRQIEKIIDTIVNVTIQTNLLAVNGSIEAARAGEYGRGFAVVSADVRNLACESGENAEKAKDLVRNIQQRITAVATDIDRAGHAAAMEVEKGTATVSAFEVIGREMEEVEHGVEAIKVAAEGVAAGTKEATVAAREIAEAAANGRNDSAQAAAAAQQGIRGMQELANAIEEVSALADEMQN